MTSYQRRRNELKVGGGGGGGGGGNEQHTSAECPRRIAGSGGNLPREILKTRVSDMPFLAIWALNLYVVNKKLRIV